MFKVLTDGCEPSKGSKYSAAIDLYASEDVTIGAGETCIVGLGVCIDKKYIEDKYYNQCIGTPPATKMMYQSEIQKQIDIFMSTHYIQLEPRSSLRAKGLIVGTGIIDLDFVGHELKLIVHNPTKPYTIKEDFASRTYVKNTDKFIIKKGDKIAQVMLCEHKSYLLGIESEVERTGGIGSTN